MAELKASRDETTKTRQGLGAVDVKPGEEGMQESEPSNLKSRAMEKRKREVEERRKLINAKRQKLGVESLPTETRTETKVPSLPKPTPSLVASPDPFALLEGTPQPEKSPAVSKPSHPADAFLAQIEQDIIKKQPK